MSHIDYRKALQVIMTLVMASMFLMAMRLSVRADEAQTFVIPANDGYGVGECLFPGAACGQTLADAWCEAHGLSKSAAFGPAEDITASTGTSDAPHADPGSFIIKCRE